MSPAPTPQPAAEPSILSRLSRPATVSVPRSWLAPVVRFVIAPILLCVSGFFTADFLLSGVYSWPRTSRVLALTLTLAVLVYEFVYKEHCDDGRTRALRLVLWSCLLPYAVGAFALLALARLAG